MSSVPRTAALTALALAFLAVLVILLSGGSTYVLHARFADAGQLVSGDLVTVGGHQVGSVGQVTLTDDGLADVQLNISDGSITPLRATTIARIGQLSLTGVANRFVDLEPGMGGGAIPDGGTLPETQTRGIVDLDTLLDSLTPRVRASIDGLLRSGAEIVGRPTAAQLNRAYEYLNPAASQSAQLGNQIVADRQALGVLVAATAQVTSALTQRSGALGGAVTNTATTLREIASERAALEDSLARAPGVLTQATRVLGHVRGTLAVLDPALAHLPPVARGLARLIPSLLVTDREAVPTLSSIRGLIAGSERALEAFPPIERLATPAVQSLTRALHLFLPDLSLLRPYIPDVVAGFFNGVGGGPGGGYDANGHYLHAMIAVQGGGGSATGLLNLLTGKTSTLGPFTGERTGLLSPCPGGGNPPARDASNPWTSPDVIPGAPTPCKPGDDQR
jgi:phospholipid/cholesterol/gamma-HCH transport system substrate-binding protein